MRAAVARRASPALFAGIVFAGIGCLLCVGGCPRPTSPAADATTGKESPQAGNTGEQSSADSGRSGESRKEEKPSTDSSRPGGQRTTGNPTDLQGPSTDTGGAAGDGAAGSAPGSRGPGGGAEAFGSDGEGGASRRPSGGSMPGRNAAVQKARDALARSGRGDARRGYRELVEAWQGLQGFTENDDESAALAAQLLKAMERLGAGLDQTNVPDEDKPLIAE